VNLNFPLDFPSHPDIISVSKGKRKERGVENETVFDDVERLDGQMEWDNF
jgi:hypothetical protein